ncbi:hypothetical protein ACP70R_037785 [Stipagrostis hirtigluma subsp. patula]
MDVTVLEGVDDGVAGMGYALAAAVEIQPQPTGAVVPHAQRLLLLPRRGGCHSRVAVVVIRRPADAACAGLGAHAVLPMVVPLARDEYKRVEIDCNARGADFEV